MVLLYIGCPAMGGFQFTTIPQPSHKATSMLCASSFLLPTLVSLLALYTTVFFSRKVAVVLDISLCNRP